MPTKAKKKTGAGIKAVDTSVLKKFLKRYENHCAQCQSIASPTITQALKKCIQNGSSYLKIILSCPGNPSDSSASVLLRPLLMTIRDERYMLGTDLCLWGISLSNQDVASLAILLELSGRTSYPFVKLEAIDCGMDVWSVERLGKAIRCSQLTSVTLDYNEFKDEGIQGLVHGLEENMKVVSLSLCYCKLGPSSGALLGKVLAESAVSELYLTGNYLQCSGAIDLIASIADHAHDLATERPPERQPEQPFDLAHQILEAQGQTGISTAISGDLEISERPATSPDRAAEHKKSKKKGRKRTKKAALPPGPWVTKLHLADNGIDAMGVEKETGVLEFSQLLSSLIRYSEQLSELDLDNNCLGEMPATDILEALTYRNQGKLPRLKIKVTAQISSITFKAILKQSKKLKVSKKKRKKKN
ncbi:uncharacterized protein LOC143988747 [Lithobates pipiens]